MHRNFSTQHQISLIMYMGIALKLDRYHLSAGMILKVQISLPDMPVSVNALCSPRRLVSDIRRLPITAKKDQDVQDITFSLVSCALFSASST